MQEGLLMIENNQLILCINGSGFPPPRVLIKPETQLEIYLGTWITGVFAPNFEDGRQVEPYHFACGVSSFCCLCDGMRARLERPVNDEAQEGVDRYA